MKASEAMLKGCEMAPQQMTAALFATEGRGAQRRVVATCALGAVILAEVGHRDCQEGKAWSRVFERFNLNEDLIRRIIRMNDFDGWSREAIAAWLARQGW